MRAPRPSPLAILLLVACGQEPKIVPTRNLDRPSDMPFVCVRASAERITGAPMVACQAPDGERPFDPDAIRTTGIFGLVLNSARGELAAVDLDNNELVDLDPRSPGFNMVPVGGLPDTAAASQDGCAVVTANRGSCDLGVVDPARMLATVFGDDKKAVTGEGPVVMKITPRTASGAELRAAPQEVVLLPRPFPELQDIANRGGECSGPSARAVVSFPGCGLVALLDLPSGRILGSVRIHPDGRIEDTGDEPVCPAQCGEAVASAGRDGGAPAGSQVSALALLPDGSRLYVGGAGVPFVAALDVTPEGQLRPAPFVEGRIPLSERPGGVTRLRLTVDPFLPGPDGRWLGRFLERPSEGTRTSDADAQQFLYALALDGSVRVVDIGRRLRGDFIERECDVNVDPNAPGFINYATGCYPIGTDPPPPRRRPLATGPGLRIPSSNPDVPPPMPRDISFAALPAPAALSSNTPPLHGAFGFLLASDGFVYVVNLDPVASAGEPAPRHQVRSGQRLDPLLVGPPSRTFSQTPVPQPVRLPVTATSGPRIERLSDPQVPTQQQYVVPEPNANHGERWSVTWEGVLPGSERDAAVLRAGDGAGRLEDVGAGFCRTGVLAGDVVLFAACDRDADCNLEGRPDRRICQQATPGAPGLCVDKDRALDADGIRRCASTLNSRRRYEVARATPTGLDLALKLDELPRTSLNACAEDRDCAAVPGYVCASVGGRRRCVAPCGPTGDTPQATTERTCRAGFVCEDVPAAGRRLCVEGPPIDPTCWPEPAEYRVQVGRGFLVRGSITPSLTGAVEEGGVCVPDGSRNPLLASRIPLDAPRCADIEDGVATRAALERHARSLTSPAQNPCLIRGPNTEDGTAGPVHVKALFANPLLRFALTNLDEYVGDAVLSRFEVTGGYFPQQVTPPATDIIITMGVRILTGPTRPLRRDPAVEQVITYPYIYVVDQGRPLSTPGGRGQILRINPRRTSSGQPAYDSNYTINRFHIQ